MILFGHGRKRLVTFTSSVPESSISILDVVDTTKYSGLVGFVIADSAGGNSHLQIKSGTESGTVYLTNSITIPDSGLAFREVNYGDIAEFAVLADSNTPINGFIFGEPIR